VLDGIEGIGGERKKVLLRAFGSLKRIQEATFEELIKVPYINEKMAQKILDSTKLMSKGG